jgi:hypothetical protein
MTGGTRVNWSDYEMREVHLSFKEAGWHFAVLMQRCCSATAAGLQ